MSNRAIGPHRAGNQKKSEVTMWTGQFSTKSQTYSKVVTLIFLGIVIFLLLTEHRDHLIQSIDRLGINSRKGD